MKKYIAYLLVFMIFSGSALAYAIGHQGRSREIPYEKTFGHYEQMPIAEGGDLRHYVTAHNPYKTGFKLWPGKGELYPGTEPHGALLTVYVNDIAYNSITGKKALANNSIVLKENYTPAKQLAAITIMYKVKGYNPEGGNWFWVKYDPDFNILKEGKVKGCLGCHGNAKDNDYIFTGKVTVE
jgi:hypothetical protein